MLATCFHIGFLLGLFLESQNGSDIICLLSTDYTALYSRRYIFIPTTLRTWNHIREIIGLNYSHDSCLEYKLQSAPLLKLRFRHNLSFQNKRYDIHWSPQWFWNLANDTHHNIQQTWPVSIDFTVVSKLGYSTQTAEPGDNSEQRARYSQLFCTWTVLHSGLRFCSAP
jgi:hypothetical protein